MRLAAWAAMCGLLLGCTGDSPRLAWGPLATEQCSPRYRVTSSVGPAREVRFAPPRRHPSGTDQVRAGAIEAVATLRTSDGRKVQRRVWSTPIGPGPASPDTPCRTRPVDPIESMIAVGWPTLPGGRVHVGEGWQGRKPEGICNALACETRDCVAEPWTHRLEGVDRGPDGGPIAVVSTDFGGHGSATARVDLTKSRLVSADATLSPPRRPGADETPAAWSLRVEFVGCAG